MMAEERADKRQEHPPDEHKEQEKLVKSRFTKKKAAAEPNNLELEVFDDHNIYSLHELTNCGFHMPTADKDFLLTHETLIKAVKMLLYKVNIQQRKLEFRADQIFKEFDKKLGTTQENMKSGFDELRHFLHNVHTDFENSQYKYRESHLELENKDTYLQEQIEKSLDTNNLLKDAVLKYATVIGCLIEYNNIQHSIQLQDGQNFTKLINVLHLDEAKDNKGRSLRSRQTSLASGVGAKSYTTQNRQKKAFNFNAIDPNEASIQ